MVALVWSDLDDEIIGGDLTAALAYATPARGAVLTPVAPIGLCDRDAGTVCFTTSLGFGRKLERIRANPRVALAHALAAYLSGDGFPMVAPVKIGAGDSAGVALEGPLPGGRRRAGLLAHRYEAQLIGLEVRQYTGWLQDGIYAPHTESGFRAPANKTLLLLANGFMARRGLKQARATSRA
jgi:hypothetical protein